MAANLMISLRGYRKRVCCNGSVLLLLCTVSFSVSAQVLIDPTKPPAEISAPVAQAGKAAAPEVDRLQSIIISPVRRAAIINGRMVGLGEKYGEAELVGVSENSVELKGAQGRQVLTLFPGVEIKKKEPPEEKDIKPIIQKKKQVKKPARRPGKKEKK